MALGELPSSSFTYEYDHRLVWPIFYHVDPSEIRHLRGSFKDSLAKQEERFKGDKEKVLKWRFALQNAANLSGDHLKSGLEYEHEFIERIVEEVSRKINQNPLHVADNLVGLEPSLQEDISS
ncbi:hypothetical protein L6164_033266 [Bauhinia variegata]|uniref:Uncharacterized protein n=1 Tax=Bauhinia variegata TaxID=167791 RepID=A0ACB9KR98_BAUVA|nr:hypothetical protein L6164_033266 [Bauhinia variegata]